MKTTYRFIIAALAAAVALSSCTKDIAADRQDTGLQDGVRTIAVSFAAQTKTTLDGLQPEFNDGDVIKVSNGSECKDITIQVDPQTNNAFFTTTLTGDLKAVYPATAAKLNGNAIEGVKVPAIQTGKFKEANICMANIDANATSATFHNKTAILRFYVDRSVDVKCISLSTKESPITLETVKIDEETIIENTIFLMAEVPEDLGGAFENPEILTNLKSLHEVTDDAGKRISYVAILPFSDDDIEFHSMASTQYADKNYSNVTLNEGDIANAFIPYYIEVNVGGTVLNPTIQRWSYCNIGAFLPEEAGYYYSWGNTTGHWRNGVSDEYPFDSEIYQSSRGAGLTNNIQPTSEYDAAFAAWANGEENTWRMPTKGEFETLLENTEFSGNSENSLLIFNNTLKIPLSGYVNGGEHKTETEGLVVGAYWTATYSGPYSGIAVLCSPSLPKGAGYPELDRYTGLPIRPIYGDPAAEGPGAEIDELYENKDNI